MSLIYDGLSMNLIHAVKYYGNNGRKRLQRRNEWIEETFERRSRMRNNLLQNAQSARIYVVDQSLDVEENCEIVLTERYSEFDIITLTR
ncbi:hypothetical protein AVEN_274201-1 [Araneus ventricosus]|uniref:Uncharacterized protein n=1 Tax=Araneus ventricosus TaxID=182803 RepID=A0A4Y2PTA0_ARAVE|nr:hypothetical protein AVEN_274201-1 [Araneus ventricosus]